MYKTEFVEAGVTWEVTLRMDGPNPGICFYRDKAHVGGPWTKASPTIGNTSLRLSFRRALAKACQRLEDRAEVWNVGGEM